MKPILSVKVSKCKTAGASVVKQKGTDPHSVSFLAGFVKELGYKRVIFQSDGEPAIVSPCQRLLRKRFLVWKSCHNILLRMTTWQTGRQNLVLEN